SIVELTAAPVVVPGYSVHLKSYLAQSRQAARQPPLSRLRGGNAATSSATSALAGMDSNPMVVAEKSRAFSSRSSRDLAPSKRTPVPCGRRLMAGHPG